MTNKETLPMFSIIVPAFNAQSTLDKCLQAVNNLKDFENYELIVADDASTDASVEIAKKYGAKVVSNPVNKGVAVTRNLGAKAAKGKILLFVDSDVVLIKDALKYFKEDFAFSNICGVFGIFDEKIVFDNFFSAYKHLCMCFGQATLPKFSPTADSAILAVYRKSFLNRGGFNENYPGVMAEDIEFSIRFTLHENKPILKDSRIRGFHLKKHNIKTLLKTNYLRIKGIAKTIQKKDYRRVYLKMSKSSSGKSIFPMALAIVFLVLSLVHYFFLFGFFVAVLIFLLAQIGLFRYFRKKKGFVFALLSVCFSFIEMFLASLFAFYFQLYYKLKK